MTDVRAMVERVVIIIIAIIIIFNLVGQSSSDLTSAADNISGSGLPLASLFSSDGVVLLVFMAGILLFILGIVFAKIKSKR